MSSNTEPQMGQPPASLRSQVERQLEKMLASPAFERASRPTRFLEFVVHRALHQPGDPVSEADIARVVYDRSDFDPRLDPIVRVDAARLRKRIREYYADHGKDDPIAIRLPQRGYVPEIILKENASQSEVPAENEVAPGNGMLLAVLPFADLSDDQQLASFCLGLTEEVIAAVSDLAGVSVVSRTSASQYLGEAVDVRVVGKNLGVTHVLEGSVRQGVEQYRVTAKLIDCASGFTAWSKTLDIASDGDTVMLQASIGGMVAEIVAEKTNTLE
jgi:adenylate cyclase